MSKGSDLSSTSRFPVMAPTQSSQHLPATTELPPGADVGGARLLLRDAKHGGAVAPEGGTAGVPMFLDPSLPCLGKYNRTGAGITPTTAECVIIFG